MPVTTFAPQNKIQTSTDYPKLTLDYNERALINAIDPNPVQEYVHQLRAPELDGNGKIVKELKKNAKGEEYEAVVYEFIGAHLCFGDFNVVSDSGVDPEGCPTCRAAVEEEGIQTPTPKFALNVVRYATQPGGWQLRDPYAVSIEAWVFAQGKFNSLIDLSNDANGDLRKYDIRLGPCENKKFQKFEMNLVPAGAAWAQSDERKKQTIETFQKNKCEDLTSLIGRRIDKTKALEDIQKAVEKTARAYGRTLGNAVQVPDLGSLVSAADAQSKPAATDDPWGTSTPDEAQAAANFAVDTTTGEVTEPAEAPASQEPKSLSFEDIMADL